MYNVAERIIFYKIVRSAAAQARAAKYMQILSLLYPEVVFSSMSSGITFICRYFYSFYWGGVTGTSFINRSLEGALGGQSELPLLLTAS